jgi:hypothetical protein
MKYFIDVIIVWDTDVTSHDTGRLWGLWVKGQCHCYLNFRTSFPLSNYSLEWYSWILVYWWFLWRRLLGLKVRPVGSRSPLLKIEKLYMLNNFSSEWEFVMKIAIYVASVKTKLGIENGPGGFKVNVHCY